MAFSLASLSAVAEPHYPPETVVAKRGDAIITMLDVDGALLSVPERMRANVMNNPKRIDELVDRLLTSRQLANEARAAHLDGSNVFKQAVKLQEDRLLSEQALVDLRAKMDIGNVEELARERYQVNPSAYALPGATSARHILIKTDSRSDKEATKLAEEIRAKAVAA